jgi:hypothetical protein
MYYPKYDKIRLTSFCFSGPDIYHVHWCSALFTTCSENHVEYVLPVCVVIVSGDAEQNIQLPANTPIA